MFVVVITRGIPGGPGGLTGQFELDQARALADAGHRVVLAALDLRSPRTWRRWGTTRTVVEGLDAVAVNWPLGAVGAGWTDKVLGRAWRSALDVIEREWGPPDMVHAHFARFGAAAARLKSERNYRLVLTEHSSAYGSRTLSDAEDRVARAAYAGADRLICVSGSLAQALSQRYGVDSTVIGNIVDTASFATLPLPADPDPAALTLVSVGNLIPRKRMDLLVDAFVRLDRPGSRLVIIGDGPERAKIEALAAPLGGRVRLPGRLDRDQIAEEFVSADGFVLLSRHETFGVVLIEAMAAGLPVLSSRSGGPEGFVVDAVGRLVPDTHDPDAVAGHLADFMAAIPAYDRAAIRDFATANFAPQVVAAQLTRLYQEVLLAD